MKNKPALLDVVALLADVPAAKLARGQVGTIVEVLDADTALVEFSDDEGRAYAMTSLKTSQFLLLQYEPEAA